MWIEGSRVGTVVLMLSVLLASTVALSPSDADAMQKVKLGLKLSSSGITWSDADPCKWEHVGCENNVVTRIQIGNQKVSGSLSPAVANLTSLVVLELMGNSLSGPLPSLKGLGSLQMLNIHSNNFESIPSDFFDGLNSLTSVYLDNNRFSAWSIPDGLKAANSLTNFSANSASVVGKIPEFFNGTTFPSLSNLHLSSNTLQGGLPSGFAGLTSLQTLWLNGQKDLSNARTLNGTITVLQNMTGLVQIWLNMNGFTGPIPDLSKLSGLYDLNLRDNSLTGPVPPSLTKIPSLKTVNLTNNALQGPTPKFDSSVAVDMLRGQNSFCLDDPGVNCDSRVNALLSVMEPFGYPLKLATGWKGNDPCNNFNGISCLGGNITVINLQNIGLTGTISPNFAAFTSLKTLILAHNNITGTIPEALTKMPSLTTLDLSYNHLDVRKLPSFPHTAVNVANNDGIAGAPPGGGSTDPGANGGNGSKAGVVVGVVIAIVCVIVVAGALLFYFTKKKRLYGMVKAGVHPNHSGSDVALKYMDGMAASDGNSRSNSGPSDVHVIETSSMIISIEVLRSVTDNFSHEKILGKGGFGTVYGGELPDGTKIAVKRMDSGVLGDKGLTEFQSEIAVLTKVRHRNLVGLLGFCLDGNEKILVYEYLPQGTLSSHLFSWSEEGLKPLSWKQRLTISLDVARGVEYLHSLAHQSFIHRDLKPSNILLGDDMRAKVADFGLVRLAPDGVNTSVATRLAGTFGYLAPEYAVMGRITTKVDVFSFGVILMELITGRRALEESQPEESVHLVTWFKRMYISKDTFQKAIDPTIDLDEETLASLHTMAELAGHCCSREPSQRPEMGQIVSVISSLTHKWKPTEDNSEDIFGIDYDMSLPQALKNWQANDSTNIDTSSSSFFASRNITQTSIPTRPSGFAQSFTPIDGR
ncbi:hypothetical protein vseg_002990 [Gypsophila vaccaria]